jgi:hypothetical protein
MLTLELRTLVRFQTVSVCVAVSVCGPSPSVTGSVQAPFDATTAVPSTVEPS